jgi:hypothetical protein
VALPPGASGRAGKHLLGGYACDDALAQFSEPSFSLGAPRRRDIRDGLGSAYIIEPGQQGFSEPSSIPRRQAEKPPFQAAV